MKIKLILFIFLSALFLTSCGTLLTPTHQKITFIGLPETRIYDNGRKLGEISEEGMAIIKVKKKLSDTQLLAKKEGYKNSVIYLDAVLNPISILNLCDVLGWLIDIATGKCCKWDNNFIEIEMDVVKE